MNPQTLIDDCRKLGVSIHLNAGAIKLRGAPEAVKTLSNKLRPHKAELLSYLSTDEMQNDIEGEYTPYVCAISPELVRELDRLIIAYTKQYRLSEVASQRIIEAAKHQALSKVPEAIQFFTRAIN
jgi:hypothetical protein